MENENLDLEVIDILGSELLKGFLNVFGSDLSLLLLSVVLLCVTINLLKSKFDIYLSNYFYIFPLINLFLSFLLIYLMFNDLSFKLYLLYVILVSVVSGYGADYILKFIKYLLSKKRKKTDITKNN